MLLRNNPKPCTPHGAVKTCVENFAPLPTVAMRVIDMIGDPTTTIADLENVLQGDIALVASVLKLANSAFYGFRRQVDSLNHALVLLGKDEVQNNVLARVLFQAFTVSDEYQKSIMVSVWKHSLECALAAECIAEYCGDTRKIYFLGGILHDIGKFVIIQNFLKEIEDLGHYGMMVDEKSLELELERFGCGHNDLGAQILHRWMFPGELVGMVREHHDFTEIKNRERPSQILMLANLLSKWTIIKDEHEDENEARECALFNLLLWCGGESKIIPGEEAALELEINFRQRLEDRADLLEMLKM